MQLNSVNFNLKFGMLQLDKQAEYSFSNDAVSDLKNVKTIGDFINKINFAQKAPIDFFINTNNDNSFRAVAIEQKTGKSLASLHNSSVHHAINNLIDIVKKQIKR